MTLPLFEDEQVRQGEENRYQIIQREDGHVDIIFTGTITTPGTPINKSTLNPIVEHVNDASIHVSTAEMDLVNRRITRIEAYLDLDSRGVSGAQARFVDTFDGEDHPVLQLDQTKTYAMTALHESASAVIIPVASTAGFSVGQQVTICDDLKAEECMITAVGSGTLTVNSLLYSYKKGAYIARTTLEKDTAAHKMRIGSWGTYTVTIAEP